MRVFPEAIGGERETLIRSGNKTPGLRHYENVSWQDRSFRKGGIQVKRLEMRAKHRLATRWFHWVNFPLAGADDLERTLDLLGERRLSRGCGFADAV